MVLPTAPLVRGLFWAGARDNVSMLVGAAPFGMILGALVGTAQLASWQGQLMSLGVFTDSSQFIAVGLMAGLASTLALGTGTL